MSLFKTPHRLVRRVAGASGLDYGAVVGLIAIVAISAASTLGTKVSESFSRTTEVIEATTADRGSDETAGEGAGSEGAEGEEVAVVEPGGDPQGNPFAAFAEVFDAEPGSLVISASQTIDGIAAPTAISVSGSADGVLAEYSIGNGPWSAVAGTIAPGESVRVRVSASEDFASTHTGYLTIGQATEPFAVTTRDANTMPIAFADYDPTVREPAERVESNVQQIEGLEAASTIFVGGEGSPEYRTGSLSAGWGDWISMPGEVLPGGQVQLRATSSETLSDLHFVDVSIGGVARIWEVRTRDPFVSPSDLGAFAALAQQERRTLVTSQEIVVGGLEAPTRIIVTGLSGQYSVNNGAWSDVAGTVQQGDRVRARLETGGLFETDYQVTLTVGELKRPFVAKTRGPFTSPSDFNNFPSQNGDVSRVYNSSIQELSVHETSLSVSFAGDGEFRVKNDGIWSDWGRTAATLKPKGAVQVRITADATLAKTYVGQLTVGNVTRSFQATTRAPVTTPSDYKEFASQTGEISQTFTSEIQTLSVHEAPIPVSFAGEGEYRLFNDNAWGSWQTGTSTLKPNGAVQTRIAVDARPARAYTAQLTVGGVTRNFKVTTRAALTTPTDYTNFPAQGGEISRTYDSAIQELNVHETTIAVSFTGDGEFRVKNDGIWSDWGRTAATLKPKGAVQVRIAVDARPATIYAGQLTVGGVTREFKVTTRDPLTTPTDYREFEEQTGLASQTFTSEIQALAVHETTLPVSLSGDGEFRVQNNGVWSSWRTAATTLAPKGSLQVRIAVGSATPKTYNAQVTVGSVARNFKVTTRAPVVTPTNLVNFETRFNATPGQYALVLARQNLEGMEASAPISVSGANAQYSISPKNAGAFSTWTSSPGTVPPGYDVIVRIFMPSTGTTDSTMTLTIGGKSVTFRAKTTSS